MKVGDLVKDNHPNRIFHTDRFGVLIKNVGHNKGLGCTNKVFRVLWHTGTIGNNVWDYDLKVVNENR